jgi:hypothetical protein
MHDSHDHDHVCGFPPRQMTQWRATAFDSLSVVVVMAITCAKREKSREIVVHGNMKSNSMGHFASLSPLFCVCFSRCAARVHGKSKPRREEDGIVRPAITINLIQLARSINASRFMLRIYGLLLASSSEKRGGKQ